MQPIPHIRQFSFKANSIKYDLNLSETTINVYGGVNWKKNLLVILNDVCSHCSCNRCEACFWRPNYRIKNFDRKMGF